MVFFPAFLIQSEMLTNLRIVHLQRFAVLINFWDLILDCAYDKKFGTWISAIVKNFLPVLVYVRYRSFFLSRTRLAECHAVRK